MPNVSAQDAEIVLNAIDSFGVLQFIEVALVILLVSIFIGLLIFSRPLINLFIETMQRNATTSEKLIGVIEGNSQAMITSKQAIAALNVEMGGGIGKLVIELAAGREADVKARDTLKESVVDRITGHTETVSKQFDAIKEQLNSISGQLADVVALPDLVKILADVITRLDKLEQHVAAGIPAPAAVPVPPVVGATETKGSGDAPPSTG